MILINIGTLNLEAEVKVKAKIRVKKSNSYSYNILVPVKFQKIAITLHKKDLKNQAN